MANQLYWVMTLTYSIVLGIILLSEIRTSKNPNSLEKSFRLMAIWVLFFCIQDVFWGICDAKVIKNETIFFISSSIFHLSTVLTTFFWLSYVLEYFGERVKSKILYLALDGIVIVFEVILIVINFFQTTLFDIVDGEYVTGPLRPFTFFNQYVVYLIIGITTLFLAFKKDSNNYAHYRSIFLSTLAPILLGIFQLMFPEAPFYSLGYFLGCFILHIFVVEKDRETYSDKEAQLEAIIELNKKLEEQQHKNDNQFEILKSISGVYDYINLLDFDRNTAYRFDVKDSEEPFDLINDPHTTLNKNTAKDIDEHNADKFWDYTNLSTLDERLKGKKIITSDFKRKDFEWIRASYIRIGDDVNEPIRRVAYALRNITNDRKREEQVYMAMENLVYSLHIFDLENDTYERLIESDILKNVIGMEESGQRMAHTIIKATCKDEFLDYMLEFVDLSTVSERAKDKDFISAEFVGKLHGWTRMTFIPIELKDNNVKKIVVTTQIIDSEKNEMMNLIYKSSTDELTRLYNRRMYEEELDTLDKNGVLEDCIIIALDVNGLKTVNDTLGHKAGDELIIGASDCMRTSFDLLGKVYRTGGDEFMAILRCDEESLQSSLSKLDDIVQNWKGRLVEKLSISYGYVTAKEFSDLTIRDLASEADKRMYEAKSNYYRNSGIERRKR